MGEVNIREARRRLTALVDAAQHGESTLITRHGHPAARIVPVEPDRPKLPDLTEFRGTIECAGKPLSQVVVESRREGRY